MKHRAIIATIVASIMSYSYAMQTINFKNNLSQKNVLILDINNANVLYSIKPQQTITISIKKIHLDRCRTITHLSTSVRNDTYTKDCLLEIKYPFPQTITFNQRKGSPTIDVLLDSRMQVYP